MLGLQGIRSYMDMARVAAETQMMQSPVTVKTNFDFVLDEYAQSLSLPPQITRSAEEVAYVRQLEQQNQELLQEIQMFKEGSEVVKNLSQAKTDEDNALTAIAGQPQ